MISNIYLSNHILSTNQCFICQKEFSFSELILRNYGKNTKKYIYYHPTCLQCIKCQRKLLKENKNFFNLIYYCGNIRYDQVLCDQCKNNFIQSDILIKNEKLQEKKNKTNFFKSFDKINTHNYGQLLFERFKQRCKFEHQQNDLIINDENYHGSCYDQDVIDIRKPNDSKKIDLNSSLTCCQKDWNNIYEINRKQCSRCHKTFTRFDIYQTNNHIDFYCNICWIYQKEFIIKNQKQFSFIRCNLCGKFLLDQLTDDIISMNFIHPKCLEKHLNDL
ncbi:unnamed protein product [Rotaria sordida]|uniref:Uncharacterized protein n=1 Tax=Rotaria sordida TaxID=392033 RepID=A0A815STR0_9BILA|nr:unnamed protein product [Rotaria sordida]CAF1494679.1 unnamed protein product [Rotaria sordida]